MVGVCVGAVALALQLSRQQLRGQTEIIHNHTGFVTHTVLTLFSPLTSTQHTHTTTHTHPHTPPHTDTHTHTHTHTHTRTHTHAHTHAHNACSLCLDYWL